MIRKFVQEYIAKLHELLDARDAPHSVAGGTAIGVFFGFIPIFGFKTLCAVGAAMLTRCSVLAAVVGVSLHDLLLPIWPLILRYQFQIGFWILSNPHHFAPKLTRGDFKLAELLQWDNCIDIGLPVVLGGIVMAVPITILTYFFLLFFMRQRVARRQLKEARQLEESKQIPSSPEA